MRRHMCPESTLGERNRNALVLSSGRSLFLYDPNSLSAGVNRSKNSQSFHCRKAVSRPVMSLHARAAELNVSVVLHTETT